MDQDSFRFALTGVRTALVIGAGHGIGFSFVRAILTQASEARIFATYRNKDKARPLQDLQAGNPERVVSVCLDPAVEPEIESFCSFLSGRVDKLDLVINCVGLLHDGADFQPEKNLAQISADQLMTSFRVNSIVSVLWAKHLQPFFKNSDPSVFASLSARVGSIGDNQLGGWYGYRASKAALNMFIRNIAIEYDRGKCNTLVMALHPGTTVTELSRPFTGNTKYELHTPEETAENLLAVIGKVTAADQGGFLDWRGESVEW